MSFQKFLENKSQAVTTSLGKYPETIKDHAAELVYWSADRADRLKRYVIDTRKLESLLNDLHYPQTGTMLSVVATKDPKKIGSMQQHFRNWWGQVSEEHEQNRRASIKSGQIDHAASSAHSNSMTQAHEVSRILWDYLGHLHDNTNEFSEELADKTTQNLIAEAEKFVQEVAKKVELAISGVKNWNGTQVVVMARPADRENWMQPLSSAEIHVGKSDFTYFQDENGKLEIDDVVDAGDEDFFPNTRVESDYFNLIRELQTPGSTNQAGKITTVYTARPRDDRSLYEKASRDISLGIVATIPPRIFVTTRPDAAVGLTHELSGPRDVWKIKIDSRYLFKTVDTGREQQYQVIGDEPVPVKWIELYYQEDE